MSHQPGGEIKGEYQVEIIVSVMDLIPRWVFLCYIQHLLLSSRQVDHRCKQVPYITISCPSRYQIHETDNDIEDRGQLALWDTQKFGL